MSMVVGEASLHCVLLLLLSWSLLHCPSEAGVEFVYPSILPTWPLLIQTPFLLLLVGASIELSVGALRVGVLHFSSGSLLALAVTPGELVAQLLL